MPKLNKVRSLNRSKLEIKLIRLIVPKLKGVKSKIKLIRLVISESRGVRSLSLFKSKVVVISKLKKVRHSSFSKPGLELIRRIIIEPIRLLILIWKLALIYNKLSIKEEV